MAYTEYGDHDGIPVFHAHGGPGSRLEGGWFHEIAKDMGVRIITTDRPGFGRSPATIRFYDWEPSTISYGYNQEVENEIDFCALEKFGFGYIRRPTGGRMVLHDNEVTYSVISPIENRLGGNVLRSYAQISKALAKGFSLMGIEVNFEKGKLSSEHQRKNANPCFSSSSRFELNYQRKKIVGSAQVRKNGVLLQHGSILLNFDQSKLAYIIPKISQKRKKKLAKYLKKKTIAINQVLKKNLDFNSAVEYLISGFKLSWVTDDFYFAESLSEEEIQISNNLIESKYLTEEWNKRK